MNKLQQIAEANLKKEPSPPPSFRDRTLSRLQDERTAGVQPSPPESPNEVETEQDPDLARQAADAGYQAAEEFAEELESDAAVLQEPDADDGQPDQGAQSDEEPSEAADEDTDEESEPKEGTVAWYQSELEKAQSASRDMERDYRQKTHKIGELTRDLEQSMAQAVTENAFYVGKAEQAIQQQFGHINWELLRTQPEEHQKATAAYQRAMAIFDEAKGRQQYLESEFKRRIEDMKDRQAQLSRSILKTTVPGWSNERVLQLREFAEAEGLYKGEVFDDFSDWQTLFLLDHYEKTSKAKTKLKPPRKRRGKSPKAAANQDTRQRNAKGQFVEAKKNFWNNPGDRGARRNYFLNKLGTERRSGVR